MLYLFYDCLWNELNESYNLFHKVQDKLQSTKKKFQEISVQSVMSVQNYSTTFRTNCSEYTKMIP